MVHVCYSRKDAQRLERSHCPTCKRRTWFYEWYQVWYGWHETCLNCGDSWSDGYRSERPFKPRWRPEAIAHAKAEWRAYRASGGAVDGWRDGMNAAHEWAIGGATPVRGDRRGS